MYKERILNREDGTRLKIKVEYSEFLTRRANPWAFCVEICPKGKRKFRDTFKRPEGVMYADDYELNIVLKTEYFKHITEDELLSVMLELWDEQKPTFNDFHCHP